MTSVGPDARRLPVLGALLAAALLSACTSGAPAASSSAPSAGPTAATTGPGTPASSGTLTWRDCGDEFECATHQVPVEGGSPVDLAVVRRRATGPGERIGSLFVNPGGPGVSAVDHLRGAYLGLPAALRARFDLVAFDPRGVGASAPVDCASTAELDRYFALDPAPDDAAELQAYDRGNARLAAGCRQRSGPVLPHVSTDAVAADLDSLRQAVGDERLTYLGYSYGTAIGAAYLDAYPDRVRAMVLDGAVDPASTWSDVLEGQGRGFDAALDAFLSDCERTRCAFREVVGGDRADLGAAFDALAARVDSEPLPGSGPRRLGPGEFTLGVGAGLYDRGSGWPALAAGLAAAQAGDGSALLGLSDAYLQRTGAGYTGTSEANLAVNCIDRPWPRDVASYTRLAEELRRTAPRFGPAIALSGLACAHWPVPPVDEPEPVRGSGSPPVVVVGTTRDPATPYASAVALAGQLDEGVLVTYDGDGHTVYRDGAPPCIQRPLDDYLLTGRSPGALRC